MEVFVVQYIYVNFNRRKFRYEFINFTAQEWTDFVISNIEGSQSAVYIIF